MIVKMLFRLSIHFNHLYLFKVIECDAYADLHRSYTVIPVSSDVLRMSLIF